MARRKAGKEQTRKLQQTGENGGSYMVTLPKELIEQLMWRKGRKWLLKRLAKS